MVSQWSSPALAGDFAFLLLPRFGTSFRVSKMAIHFCVYESDTGSKNVASFLVARQPRRCHRLSTRHSIELTFCSTLCTSFTHHAWIRLRIINKLLIIIKYGEKSCQYGNSFPTWTGVTTKRPNIFVLNVFIQKNIIEIRSCYDNLHTWVQPH